jgi:superfamily II DNA or RNA helicase
MAQLTAPSAVESTERTLAAVGELRTGQFEVLEGERSRLDVLVAAPGHSRLPLGAADLYRRPAMPLSMRLARELQVHFLDELASDIDALPKGAVWGERLLKWAQALRMAQTRVRFWDSSPLYTRLISGPDKSLVFAEPIHVKTADASTEIKLSVEGDEHTRIRTWFADLFERSRDIAPDMLACIDGSWAGQQLSPRDAYLKVLASYFDEVLYSLDRDFDTNPMLDHLTEFQVEAYHYAKFILRRYGGVFLADVVGLGKTYTAMAILKHLQDSDGEHAVIVAPPKVLPAWEALAAEHRVEVKLVSLGKLSKLTEYTDREILVIDESHNLRNADTGRYAELTEWVRPPGEPATRRVLLLSATPQNNSVTDLRNQLGLFPDNYTRLPLKAESLDSWCRDVRAGAKSASELLQHVVVRRTRKYIKAAFPRATLKQRKEDGAYESVPIRFPVRKSGAEQCLRYSLTETYHGGIYQQILEGLRTLKYPLHSLGEYLSTEGAEDPRARGVRRSRNTVRGLFKVLLLKRLESSACAFRISLERLKRRLEEALQNHSRGIVLLAGETVDDEAGEDEPLDRSLPVSLFDDARFLKAMREDHIEVKRLLSMVEGLDATTDAKIHRLMAFLERRPPGKHKVLIFSQFVDTVEYVAGAVRSRYPNVAVATGADSRALSSARQFSPRSNRYTFKEGEHETSALVSTDVLSEGVNLQDADTLVNYDLHWNPVRLIQRAGRIDRIGSEHEEIEVASFLPESELEAGLGLEEVLRRRIREFIEVFGEDSQILPDDASPQEDKMLRAYSGEGMDLDQDESDSELDALSRHQEQLLTLRRDSPEEYNRIIGLRNGRFATVEGGGADIVASRVGSFWYFWTIRDGETTEVSARYALDSFQLNGMQTQAKTADAAAGWERLGKVETKFHTVADMLRLQQSQPRLSPSMVTALKSLEQYFDGCAEPRRQLAHAVLEGTRARAGHPTLERSAHRWRKERLGPQVVFAECKRLVGSISSPSEELGDAILVAGSFRTGS